VLAIYGPETMSADETPTQPTATSQITATDNRTTSTAAKSVELNVPEILVHN